MPSSMRSWTICLNVLFTKTSSFLVMARIIVRNPEKTMYKLHKIKPIICAFFTIISIFWLFLTYFSVFYRTQPKSTYYFCWNCCLLYDITFSHKKHMICYAKQFMLFVSCVILLYKIQSGV